MGTRLTEQDVHPEGFGLALELLLLVFFFVRLAHKNKVDGHLENRNQERGALQKAETFPISIAEDFPQDGEKAEKGDEVRREEGVTVLLQERNEKERLEQGEDPKDDDDDDDEHEQIRLREEDV